MPKRVLVLGANGMLGHKLADVLSAESEIELSVAQRNPSSRHFPKFQISAGLEESVEEILHSTDFDFIINCIGVVKQSAKAQDLKLLFEVNAEFPIFLAELCKSRSVRLLHISTDCVFSGRKGHYKESDIPDPVDDYGKSKLVGESASELGAMVLRTSIIGRELPGSKNGLLEWFLSNAGKKVDGYTNAYFSGLTTKHFSEIVSRLLIDDQFQTGLWNVASSRISKFELLSRLNELLNLGISITPKSTPVLDRSLDATLIQRRFGLEIEDWEQMLIGISKENQ